MAATCTIEGQIIDFIDTTSIPATSATIVFEPSVSRLNDVVNNDVILLNESWVDVDSSGQFSVNLIATDDPNINPTNWTYLVKILIKGRSNGKRQKIESFSINAPAGQTLNLADIVPVSTSPGVITIQGPPGSTYDREFPVYWDSQTSSWETRPSPLPEGFDRAIFKSFWDATATDPSALMEIGDTWWKHTV